MAHFNWTQNHEETLRNLKKRYEVHGGRNRGRVLRDGRRAKLSERQYVIARFRGQYGVRSNEVSDQAIWAKYLRVNGELGARRRPAAINRARLETKYQSPTGMVFTPGMTMKSWDDLGLPRLGKGATRIVYDLGGEAVLKVGYKSGGRFDGVESNKREARVWEKVAGSADEQYFAKVLAADPEGRWLVMERVTPNTNGAVGKADAARAGSRYNVTDLHWGNFGQKNGRVVITDYASA